MQQEENNGFGPFYKQRGSGAIWVAITILVAFVVMTFLAERPLQHNVLAFYFFAISLSLLAYMVGEMARRLCLFGEEVRHCHSRYEGSMKKAFKEAFDFQNSKLIALIAIISLGTAYVSFYDMWYSYKAEFTRLFFLNAIFIPLFVFLFGLRKLSRVEYSQVNEKENKNLADGLAWAWGYYFGYLKFVLPALENQINLTEKYRYEIKNCLISNEISNKQSDPKGLVRSDGNLEPLKKKHGGIENRTYKHTVHSLRQIPSRPKDPVEFEKQSGVVYRIPCGECSTQYIGETGRALRTRRKEHEAAVRLGKTSSSALAEHASKTGHPIDWKETSILCKESRWSQRRWSEAIEIAKQKSVLFRSY
ncbi:stimulator of interferon genes protein-like [Exaiptasia diaphana]|uniref:GIY-YIG domain-containing protein n=1 Tax=Exaiptasia diaphana TaxID=2652724 RepID=A0A913XP82_EXADI|nr:stimulator of interferon genes protein-like [Exaiptasia diaphana]